MLLAMASVVAIGTPVARYLSRAAAAERVVWQAVLLVSILLPPLALGILLALAFGPHEPAGIIAQRVGIRTSNSAVAFVFTQVYVSIGYYVLAAMAAFDAVPRALEDQAALLGSDPRRVFFRVTFPLARLGLAVALDAPALDVVNARAAKRLRGLGQVTAVAHRPWSGPAKCWRNFCWPGDRPW